MRMHDGMKRILTQWGDTYNSVSPHCVNIIPFFSTLIYARKKE